MATKSTTKSASTKKKASSGSASKAKPKTELATTKTSVPAKTKKTGMSKGKKFAAAAVGVAAVTAAGVAVAVARRGSKVSVLHVQPKDDRWQVMVEGNKNASGVFDTKKEAVDWARETAHKRVPSELVVHRADGSEQDRHSYEAS